MTMNRKTLATTILAVGLALAAGPALAENGSNGPRDPSGKGTNSPSGGFGVGGGGGIQYSTVEREPSRQPTGSVPGNTGVGICGCH